ncbi:activity-dependent neuroprotective protein 2a [Chanos chanos]|uniref:Activity-dependent neuroprotective protein 2a n=1 Tax=Chanos chanos TaxID=29144 RepID=A0A6J2W127_CHACN|nr:activity-dependent neuroprotector homeobox protein 2-like [Chanos chanos]
MYQLPVGDVEKIRKSRKRVKSILCDIALEDCQDLIEKLKPFDSGEDHFNNTEWDDFTEGHNGKRRKKWGYRTLTLCCSLCWFSTQSWYTFRGHVQRCHEEELDLASLSPCSKCSFIGHPKVTEQHVKFFHTTSTKGSSGSSQGSVAHSSKSVTVSPMTNGDRYICKGCGYHDSLIYVMKKHVLVNHYASMLNRYFGHRSDSDQAGSTRVTKYFCRVCGLPAESTEHLLYHMLSSDKHKELQLHIKTFICENMNKNGAKLPALAPKVQQQVVQKTVVVPQANSVLPVQQSNGNPVTKATGTVLLAAPSNTTALLCSPGARQVFLPSQTEAKSLVVPGSTMATLQNTPLQQTSTGIRPGLPTSAVVKASISMLVPNVPQAAPKPVPITVTVPRLPQAVPPRQILLPPGAQINVPGKIGIQPPQPLLVTQRLPLNQSAPRPPIIASQSVRLIPTGNKVNGVPTYTLAPVQVTVPVQTNAPQVVNNRPVILTQNNMTTTAQLSNVTGAVPRPVPSTPRQSLSKNAKVNELAVLAPFLKKMDGRTVKCLRCKILLAEKGIFQHLLHGLKCLFCPQMFYSFKQIMDHTNKEHNLSVKGNQEFIKKHYKLNIDNEGKLVFAKFDLNTDVPKDLLENRELNLALVTGSQDKIYIKMYPDTAKTAYSAPLNSTPTDCPFCQEKPQTSEDYELHLKTKHHIVPTIHAILKSPAFKCIYCLGVYAEKSTPKTISIHVQRCRCAPKAAKEAERLVNPDLNGQVINGSVQNPVQKGTNTQTQVKLKTEKPAEEGREEASANREITVVENGKESVAVKSDVPDSSVPLLLDPTGLEMKSFEERKKFLKKYFHLKPYLSKMETETLAARLWFNRTDVASLFGSTRSRCMKAIQKKRTVVLLGFNMTEVNKVKHNLLIPEVEPAIANV